MSGLGSDEIANIMEMSKHLGREFAERLLRSILALLAAKDAECKAHREALGRFLSIISPTGFEEGLTAEEAFEQALACVVADRELDRNLSAKDAEIARLREALEWISDPRLHSMHGDPQSLMEKARAALEGKHG